jgi:hypothetical protein
LNDTVSFSNPVAIKTSSEGEIFHPQRKFWRPGVKKTSGTITFFPTIELLKEVFDIAKYGKTFVITNYYSKKSVFREYTGCKINTMDFSVVAGEDTIISLNIIAERVKEYTGEAPSYTETKKIINYGIVDLTTEHKYFYGLSGQKNNLEIQSFNFSINNSCKAIYTAQKNINEDVEDISNRLDPKEIRNGIQEVSGSITYYTVGNLVDNLEDNQEQYPFLDDQDGERYYTMLDEYTKESKIYIKINDNCEDLEFDESLCVVYQPVKRLGGVGVMLQTLTFQGVGFALGSGDG